MKILLIRNDNIGDLICTTPAIQALRKANPTAQIDIVVNSLNACVVKNNPFIDNVLIYTKPKHEPKIKNKIKAGLNKLKLLFKIYRTGYDVAVILRSQHSNAASIFARVSRAKQIIGVKNVSPINLAISLKDEFHEVECMYALFSPLGAKNGGEKSIYIPDKKSDDFKDKLIFHISSRLEQNRLSEDKICQIIAELKPNYKIAISAEDKVLAKAVSQKTNTKIIPSNNFEEAARYMANAKGLLSLDGGIAHLGPALNLPTVAIFGKTNPKKWAPYSPDKSSTKTLSHESKIAQNISVDDIVKAVKETIK